MHVAPLAGAWIEIPAKYYFLLHIPVAPLAGAWIEMAVFVLCFIFVFVAPLAGAWIEICGVVNYHHPALSSLPLRERGLKSTTCQRSP